MLTKKILNVSGDLCESTSECQFFSWVARSFDIVAHHNKCFLKKSDSEGIVDNNGVISGAKGCKSMVGFGKWYFFIFLRSVEIITIDHRIINFMTSKCMCQKCQQKLRIFTARKSSDHLIIILIGYI